MFSKGTENVSKVEWYLQSIDTDRLEDLLSWSRTGRSRIAAVLDTSSYLIVEMMCCTCVSVISQWRSEFLQCQRSIGYTVCIRTTYMHSLTHASTALCCCVILPHCICTCTVNVVSTPVDDTCLLIRSTWETLRHQFFSPSCAFLLEFWPATGKYGQREIGELNRQVRDGTEMFISAAGSLWYCCSDNRSGAESMWEQQNWLCSSERHQMPANFCSVEIAKISLNLLLLTRILIFFFSFYFCQVCSIHRLDVSMLCYVTVPCCVSCPWCRLGVWHVII